MAFGLIDMQARMYSPLLGRFLSADTVVPRPGDPQSLNRYSYTRNNPVSRIDSDGHADEPFWKKACQYFGFCQPPPNMAPAQGVSLNVNEGSVEVVAGPDGQIQAAKGDSIKGKVAKVGGNLLALLLGVLGGSGGGGPEKVKKVVDGACGGDCSDEASAVGQLHHIFSNRIMAELAKTHLGVYLTEKIFWFVQKMLQVTVATKNGILHLTTEW
jgi:RHS repeat-associated protein